MAAPNPAKEWKRLEALLGSGKLPKVFVILGQDAWFRGQALALVRKGLPEGEAGGENQVELDGLDRESLSHERIQDFLMDLGMANLFGGGKILIVRNASKWVTQAGKSLLSVLERMAPGNSLVIEAERLDGRSSIARKLKKEGAWFEFRRLYDRPFGNRPAQGAELVQWVQEHSRTKGLRLDPSSALFLTEVCGSDPGILDGELTRLAGLVESKNPSPKEMREVLTLAFESTQFEFVEALLNKDLARVLRSLRALETQGLRDRDGKRLEVGAVFPMVTSWLSTTLEKGFVALRQREEGRSLEEVIQEHGGYFKERFASWFRKNDRGSLERIQAALVRAETRLRSMGEDPMILLEQMLREALLQPRRRILEGEFQ
jgi:DNA polymerase III delta subunit